LVREKQKTKKNIDVFRNIGYVVQIVKAEARCPIRSATRSDGIAPARLVIPAQAGIQVSTKLGWMPAFAGMTRDCIDPNAVRAKASP
jgi:hypothetical protein